MCQRETACGDHTSARPHNPARGRQLIAAARVLVVCFVMPDGRKLATALRTPRGADMATGGAWYKAAACSAARAICWLLAFWTFLWSCFLLMEYVSGPSPHR